MEIITKTTDTKLVDLTDGILLSTLMDAAEMQDESLLKCVDRLLNYRADILLITDDYAPKSFQFGLYRRTEEGQHIVEGERCQLYINGGIIYHGQHDRGGDGSAPTFAVCLTPVTGWSIHT